MKGESEKAFFKWFTIASLALFFVTCTLPLYLPLLRSFIPFNTIFDVILLEFFILVVIFLLYTIIMLVIKGPAWLTGPTGKPKPTANTMLTCKHGHTVPVWINYDGRYDYGYRDSVSKANIWPEKCPICGAHWRIPELQDD